MKKNLGLIMLAVSLSTLGCGGGEPGTSKKPVFPTTGMVTLFGAPLADATIAFAPTASGQPTAIGRTDATGNFTLTTYQFGDGAAEGSFKVVVTKAMNMGEAAGGGGGDDGHGDTSGETADSGGSHSASGSGGAAAAGMVAEIYGSSETTPLTADVKSDGENFFSFDIK